MLMAMMTRFEKYTFIFLLHIGVSACQDEPLSRVSTGIKANIHASQVAELVFKTEPGYYKAFTTNTPPTCGVYAVSRHPEYFKTDAELVAMVNRYSYSPQDSFGHLLFPGTRLDTHCSRKDAAGNCITPTVKTLFEKTILRFTSEESHHRAEGQRYHGCCVSKTVIVSPDNAKDELGRDIRLVQIEGHRQVFKSETCRQLADCSMGCNCRQDLKEVKAIVYNPDVIEYLPHCKVMDVYIPGCCKCLNTT